MAALAAKVDGAEPGMKGICLRGLPGWVELGAPLTSVVNTFGGTWFTKDWKAQVNSGGFKKATHFYVDLVRKHGEAGAAQSGFTDSPGTGEETAYRELTAPDAWGPYPDSPPCGHGATVGCASPS